MFLNVLKVIYLFIVNPYHLWFVSALIIAIFIEYYFLKNKKLKMAIVLGIILYAIALLGNSYYFLIENTPLKIFWDIALKVFITFRNGIFVGFPLFTIGICIAFKEDIIKKISKRKLVLFLFIFIFTQTLEAMFIRENNYKDDHSLFISINLIATVLLMICINFRKFKLKKLNSRLLRNLSTGIYYMHLPICKYIQLIIPDINNWILFIITILLTIIINVILLKVNNKYINLLIK